MIIIYLLSFLANNLYGYAQSEPMATGNYKWLEKEEFEIIDWTKLSREDQFGYILEIDLGYPRKLHRIHSDFPLAPIRRKVLKEELSDYQLEIIEMMKQNNMNWKPTEKLILDLHDKNKYVIHYLNLKLYLELGLELKKVHRVLKFEQSRWLAKYIDLNTKLREKAEDKFTQDLLKLFNNSVFGKSCENVRNHVNIKLALTQNQAKNYLKKPLFSEFKIISENKVIIKMRKSSIILNKPIIIGFTVLELSKNLMFQLYYNVFLKKFPRSISLCYSGMYFV